MPIADVLGQRDGAFGAAADPTLLARLDLKIGDRVNVGSATFQIRSARRCRTRQARRRRRFRSALPDQRSRACAPPACCSPAAWCAGPIGSSCRQCGRRPRRRRALIDDARTALPQAGWEVRSRDNASPQLERTISRFTQFLTLVGLAALLVGGVGVANAVKSHIDRRRDVIAAFKAVGATGRDVFAIYLTQVIVLAAIGSVDWACRRRRAAFVIVGLFGKDACRCRSVPALHPDELALSLVYGLLTALAFGLWPLGRVHDVPVAALFRETVSAGWHRPRWRYLALMAAVIALLIAVVIGLAYDKRVAAVFVVSAIVVFVLLRGVAAVLMALARRLPRARIDDAAARNHQYLPARRVDAVGRDVARPRARRAGHDHPDRRQSAAAIPGGVAGARAVVLFHRYSLVRSRPLHRLPASQTAPGSTVEDVPMLRGRIVAARGVKAEDLHPSTDSRVGAAKRPRPDLYRRNPEGLEDRRGQMVGRRL